MKLVVSSHEIQGKAITYLLCQLEGSEGDPLVEEILVGLELYNSSLGVKLMIRDLVQSQELIDHYRSGVSLEHLIIV